MAEKHIVVDGAICMCNFGATPDKLKVLSNQKEYANDMEGRKLYIASTMDVGSPFQNGTFGVCAKLRGPCKSAVLQWNGFYEKTTLSNNGKVLLEDSKATCPVGGTDCIRILFHGQIAEPEKQNFKKVSPTIAKVLNPLIEIREMENDYKEVE